MRRGTQLIRHTLLIWLLPASHKQTPRSNSPSDLQKPGSFIQGLYVLEVKVLLDFSIREWYISYLTVSPLITRDSWDLLKSNYSSNMQNIVVLHFLTPALFQAAAWRYLLYDFWKQAIKTGKKLITYSYSVKNTTWQIIYIWTRQLLNINTEQYFVKYISYRQGVVYRTKHHQDLWQLMGRWWKCILSYPRKKKKENLSSSHEEGIKTHRPETSRQQ